jgi:hypothetical protein
MTDLRIFKSGSHKSHIYESDSSEAICGRQRLRAYDSSSLPEYEPDSKPSDLCDICESVSAHIGVELSEIPPRYMALVNEIREKQ